MPSFDNTTPDHDAHDAHDAHDHSRPSLRPDDVADIEVLAALFDDDPDVAPANHANPAGHDDPADSADPDDHDEDILDHVAAILGDARLSRLRSRLVSSLMRTPAAISHANAAKTAIRLRPYPPASL